MDSIETLLFTLLFMAIGASHWTTLHLLVTAHALAMIGSFEPYIRFLRSRVIVKHGNSRMAFPTRKGRILGAMVVAFRAIAGNIGMLAV